MQTSDGTDTSKSRLLGIFPVAGTERSVLELAVDFPEGTSASLDAGHADRDTYLQLSAAFLLCLRKYGEDPLPLCAAEVQSSGGVSDIAWFTCEITPEQTFAELTARLRESLERQQDHDPSALGRPVVTFQLSDLADESPVSVQFQPRPRGVQVVLRSYAERAEHAAIERFLLSYAQLLRGALARPTSPIRALRAVPEEARAALLARFEGLRVDRDPAQDVLGRFGDQVAARGEQLALIHGAQRITYRALAEQSERLAERLAERGIREGDVVAIWAERTPSTIVALIATLRLGACCLTVDPALPIERVRMLLDSGRARIVVGNASRATVGPALEIASAVDEAPRATQAAPRVATNPERAFCILFTSGSTGRPKGVRLPHRTFSNLIAWHMDAMPVPAGTRTLQFAALSFDVSLQEIFSTLCAGGTLVLLPSAADQKNPQRLLEIIEEYKVERLFMPFVALQQLAKTAYDQQQPLRSLRQVVTGGEQLRITPHVAWLFATSPDARLYNHYGPTETHVVTSHALPADPQTWTALPPIGASIDNAAIYLLDADLDVAAQDAIGEVFIAGASVAIDYIGASDLTKARFLLWGTQDHVPGARLYRTGDLARADAAGQLCFVGRRDTQVKVRGFRFEPAELEATLCQHGSVADATAVVVSDGDSSDARIVAFVVAARSTLYERELRRFLADRLPAFALPSRIVRLESFPRTLTGKVDRLALAHLAGTRSGPASLGAAPVHGIREVWVDLLRHDNFGPDDNFFEVGGNSMMALRLFDALREKCGISVVVEDFLERPTMRALEVLVGHA